MVAKRLMAAIIVGMMVMSGLGIVSVGAASDNEPILPESIEPIEKNTVQRVVLMEDFTGWNCVPCASFNPALSTVFDGYGYTKIAPAMYHVSWPNYDDDPMYQYNKNESNARVAYYGCNYVPWFIVDGVQKTTSTTASVLQGYFNTALAVPANVDIFTQGSLSGTSGEITTVIEAVEPIAATDLRVFVQLWETNITRPLWNYRTGLMDSIPYPNGETILEWAVWDMIPSDLGTPIWPTGAAVGDKVELSFPITLNSSWNINEIGVTVFVQGYYSRHVEQAAVELFDQFPPIATLLSPNPATSEQILSGTIPIVWSASDVEDAPGTLDISLDYSPNGGFTWINIMSGTNNNVAPYTYNWNTVVAGIPDGTGYLLRVKAKDSSPEDYGYSPRNQAFSIDNTIDDEWFLQVESTGANLDLNMNPVEINRNLKSSAAITVAGNYKVGTWQTTKTFNDKNINGDWTFKVYGKTPNPGFNPLVAYLNAKVFTSSNTGTPLDTTANDNENVGTFKTTHLFTWTETLSGTIANGDSIIVEIWLNAVGGPYPPVLFNSLNPGFTSVQTPWQYTNVTDNGDGEGTAIGHYFTTGGNPDGYVDVVLTPKSKGDSLRIIRCGYWEIAVNTGCIPTNPVLTLDYAISTIGTDLEFTYVYAFIDERPGGLTGGTPALIASSVWNAKVNAVSGWASIGPIDVSAKVTENTTYYLKVLFRTALDKGVGTYTAKFDDVKLSWTQASPVFSIEHDYGTTPSSIVPFLGSAGGPTPAVYNIPMTGITAGNWAFVSFPIGVSGNIGTLLPDETGGTTWNVAKWWDGSTQSWKTFRRGSSINSFTDINNHMGVWLHLTANAGDQLLPTSSAGLYPTSGVVIQLYAGWNIVGYPSATNRAADTVLSGTGATMVSVYQTASPYVLDYATLGSVTMSNGHAYWVKVPADCTYVVNP